MADYYDQVIEHRAKNPNRHKDYWQESEKALLKEMYLSGYGITELALRFDRSELAIFNQILNMDIIPRSRGTREKKSGCRCPGCSEYGSCDKLRCQSPGEKPDPD